MSDFYERLSYTTLNLVKSKGRDVIIFTPVGQYTPGTGYTTQGSQQQTAKAVFTSYNLNEIDGTLIRREDKKCLIAAESLTSLTLKDKIKEGVIDWSIVSIDVIKPADTPLLYKIQVRK